MPSRRTFLTAVVGTATGGCLHGPPTDPAERSTRTRARSPSPTTPTADPSTVSPTPVTGRVGETLDVDGAWVTVERVLVQDSLMYASSPDSMAVATSESGRYVLVEVSVSGELPPGASQFAVLVDGEQVGGSAADHRVRSYGDPVRGPYDTDRGGWLVYTVPAPLDASTAAIAVEGTRWRFPDRTVERLRDPLATYDLVGFDAPAKVTPDQAFAARVTVENVGNVAGTFRGVLNAAGGRYAFYPYPFELDLPVGGRTTWTKEFPAGMDGLDEPGEAMRLHLRTAAGDRHREVECVAGTAASTATEGG